MTTKNKNIFEVFIRECDIFCVLCSDTDVYESGFINYSTYDLLTASDDAVECLNCLNTPLTEEEQVLRDFARMVVAAVDEIAYSERDSKEMQRDYAKSVVPYIDSLKVLYSKAYGECPFWLKPCVVDLGETRKSFHNYGLIYVKDPKYCPNFERDTVKRESDPLFPKEPQIIPCSATAALAEMARNTEKPMEEEPK